MNSLTFPEMVRAELQKTRAKHRPMSSAHEGYAVLLEEVDEFWDEVKKRRENRSWDRMVEELVQVATMAQRIAEDVMGVSPGHPQKQGGAR